MLNLVSECAQYAQKTRILTIKCGLLSEAVDFTNSALDYQQVDSDGAFNTQRCVQLCKQY